jgi:hypothetical protein
MGYRFNDVAETLGIHPVKCEAYLTGVHPVTAGRCAEKGKKFVDNDDRVWDIFWKQLDRNVPINTYRKELQRHADH